MNNRILDNFGIIKVKNVQNIEIIDLDAYLIVLVRFYN